VGVADPSQEEKEIFGQTASQSMQYANYCCHLARSDSAFYGCYDVQNT